MSHGLKRARGRDRDLIMEYLGGALSGGDRLLLVSEGVWATLSDSGIRSILADQGDLQDCVSALVNGEQLAGSQDNASALLIQVESLGHDDLGDTLRQLQQWPLPPQLKPGQQFEGWQVDKVVARSPQSLLCQVFDASGQPWLLQTDRQSVGLGKSVDLGGLRIILKKT